MTIAVRRATPADVEAAAPLFDAYRQFYGQTSDLARSRDFLTQRLTRNESIVFLAFDDADSAVGFTQLYPAFSSVRTARIFILNDLFVPANARKQGVGEQLIAACVAHAGQEGAASLSLTTGVENFTAQRLYESLGWKRETEFLEYHFNV
jgi:ribosomal protein S18 acetylase RimI-like enzyme